MAAALDRLSPDYRFTTSVYAPARPDAAGTVRGDLIIYGRGDPSIGARVNNPRFVWDRNSDDFRAINDLASRITAAGVKRVEGDLIGDESYYSGPPLGVGWEWDDLQWYYGAEVSALTVTDNALTLLVKPGASLGAPCTVTTNPATSIISITNRTTTTPRGTARQLEISRPLGTNVIEVGGSLPHDDPGYTAYVAVTQPAQLFVDVLRSLLAQRGVVITGRTRTVDARARGGVPLQTASLVELTNLQSPPLSLIAAQMLKPSHNLYAELVLRALSKTVAANPAEPSLPAGIGSTTQTNTNRPSVDAGLDVLKTFLQEAGVDVGGINIRDGSGLSRQNLITTDSTLRLLTYMSRHRYASAFRDALPIGGMDGTLATRLKGTPAANNVRAKTGSLSQVATLSGYVTSAAGERLVFSILVNNYIAAPEVRRTCIDPIAVLLASFAGRS